MSGLQLLSPWGLLALTVVLLPLAIHLFHRSRGRRVWVGNAALYRQAKRYRLLERRIQQWPLLLLRLILLGVAALWLGELAGHFRASLPGHTVYVTPQWLQGVDAATVAALPGDQQFVLTPGYPSLNTALAKPATVGTARALDVCSLLVERSLEVDHEQPISVYASADFRQFSEVRCPLTVPIDWYLDEAVTLTPPLPSLQVQIYHSPERQKDAALLKAALDLVAVNRAVSIATAMVDSDTVASASVPALFAASDLAQETNGAALSASPTRWRVAIILAASTEAERRLTEQLTPKFRAWDTAALLLDTPGSGGRDAIVRLPGMPDQRVEVQPAADEAGDVMWRTEDGLPLLRVRYHGRTAVLRYYGYLGATRHSLAASEMFPVVLLRLLLGKTQWQSGFASAPVHASQLLEPSNLKLAPHPSSFRSWLTVLLLLLIGLERWWSERPSRVGSV